MSERVVLHHYQGRTLCEVTGRDGRVDRPTVDLIALERTVQLPGVAGGVFHAGEVLWADAEQVVPV